MINEWDLTKTNQQRLKENMPDVAVIPTSATEPHNLHLPEGQDFLHTTIITDRACEMAWKKCRKVIALPTIPYGVDCNLMDFPIAVHVSQATLDAMIRDIIFSLHHYGIKKIVLLNGHGGNDFTPFIRQIQTDLDSHIFQLDWWKVGMDKYNDIFDTDDDHAGEVETSVALALYPELVEMQYAKNAPNRPFRFEALQKGWARTSRRFARLNDYCATGDPSFGTAEKGHKYLDLVIGRISKFLVDLAESPIDDDFPHI
jgi:creatinine amidohydrolase